MAELYKLQERRGKFQDTQAIFRFGLSFFFGIWFYVLFHNCRMKVFNLSTFFIVDLVVIAYVILYEKTKYTSKIEVSLILINYQSMILMSQIAQASNEIDQPPKKDIEKDGEVNSALGIIDLLMEQNRISQFLSLYSKLVSIVD